MLLRTGGFIGESRVKGKGLGEGEGLVEIMKTRGSSFDNFSSRRYANAWQKQLMGSAHDEFGCHSKFFYMGSSQITVICRIYRGVVLYHGRSTRKHLHLLSFASMKVIIRQIHNQLTPLAANAFNIPVTCLYLATARGKTQTTYITQETVYQR